MPDAAIILINGYPGVGKNAVATELAQILPNSRVLDTHLLDIAAKTLHPQGCSQAVNLRKSLRETVLESLAATRTPSSPGSPLEQTPPIYILTDTILTSEPTKSYQGLYLLEAKAHHLPLIHLVITCSTEANMERIKCTARPPMKSRDDSHVLEVKMESEIVHFVKPGRIGRGGARGLELVEGLAGEYEVDTTSLTVRETAGILGEYILDTLRGEGWWFQFKRR